MSAIKIIDACLQDIHVLNINVLLEMHNGSAVTLFGTILVDDRAKS